MTNPDFGRKAFLSTLLVAMTTGAPSVSAADSMEPIFVTPNRSAQTDRTVPSRVDVITRRQIEQSGARDLATLLRGNGSIQGQSFGEGSRAFIAMSGFAETAHSNVLVMVDGRRLNNPDIAPPNLASISLKDIERIEVVHGSGSTLYGDQAVAGVINIITRAPASLEEGYSAQTLTRIEGYGGSYNTRGAQAGLEHRNSSGFVMRLSGEDRKTDNYREHNAQDYNNGLARLGWEHDSGAIYFEGQYSGDRLELPGALSESEKAADRRQSTNSFSNDYSRVANRIYRISFDQALGKHWTLNTDVSRQDSDGDFIIGFAGGAPSTNRGFQERTQDSVSPKFTGQIETARGPMTVTTGIDYQDNNYLLQSQFGLQKNRQKKADGYVQVILPVTPRVSAVGGARYAHIDSVIRDTGATAKYPNGATLDHAEEAWEFGINFLPDQNSRLFARVESTFRFPKVDEELNTQTGASSLQTQTGLSSEIGAEIHSPGLTFGVSAYVMKNDDEIGFLPGSLVAPFGANVNIDETTRKGLNISIRGRAGDRFEIFNNWHYVHTEGVFQGQHFNQMPLASRHVIDAGIAYRAGAGIRLGFEARYVDDRPFSGDFDRSQGRLPDHTVADVTFDWEWRDLRLNARVENIFDREFTEFGAETFSNTRSYFPMPDRNVVISLEHAL